MKDVRVVSQTYGHVRAGTRVKIMQMENNQARVRVVSVGWNQSEIYVLPKSILGI
jgi:hypothetical protein